MIDLDKLKVIQEYSNYKKELGQYFTNQTVASYMCTMFNQLSNFTNSSKIRVLDPGAGNGSLSIALILQCISLGYKNIELVVYEVDADLITILQNVFQKMNQYLSSNDIYFNYNIKHKDFVLARPDKKDQKFNFCIMNPPYFKYLVKESKYGGKTADLFKGDPNIYASFIAIGLNCLEKNGQLVAIVPRSFTNGLYFKGFREYLTSNSSLEKIHIFQARNKVFKESKVLQENIICKFVKAHQSASINIISSFCDKDIKLANSNIYKSSIIIDTAEKMNIIHIPTTFADAKIMLKANSLPSTFDKEGYFISTGKVVSFRTREYITNATKAKSAPLIMSHNIKEGKVYWDGQHQKDTLFLLKKGYEKHVNQEDIYVLVKRFTSKDDKKRLVAGTYVPFYNQMFIGFDNKINYLGRKNGDFTLIEAHGLSAVLNSTFMDKYFRCFSGNTQVNASEIRIMKFPTRQSIIHIGNDIINIPSYDQNKIDKIVEKYMWRTKHDK